MDWKEQTLDFYDQNADEFAEGTLPADMSDTRERFSSFLPPKGIVLDFGCGAGRDTKAFLEDGFRVDAVDGSKELCEFASGYTGIEVKQMLFSELDADQRYDGIWACASILHLPRAELASVIGKMEKALKYGGVLYASFKYGIFEGMRNGRYFIDFTEAKLQGFWESVTDMPVFDMWITQDVRSDRKERKWINLLARRV
jgi:SAM-dependent methyltransferase